jgi:diacylglycerol kinase family enzyme
VDTQTLKAWITVKSPIFRMADLGGDDEALARADVAAHPQRTVGLGQRAAGVGFDAAVAERARRGWALGTVGYLLAVVKCLGAYQPAPVLVSLDDESAAALRVAAVVAANGAYYGGGMKIAPSANPSDGKLEVVVLGEFGRMELLRWLPPGLVLGIDLQGAPERHAVIAVDVRQASVLVGGEQYRRSDGHVLHQKRATALDYGWLLVLSPSRGSRGRTVPIAVRSPVRIGARQPSQAVDPA